MRHLFNFFLVTGGRHLETLDADLNFDGPFVSIGESAASFWRPAWRHKVPRQIVGRRGDLPKAAYLAQYMEALSG